MHISDEMGLSGRLGGVQAVSLEEGQSQPSLLHPCPYHRKRTKSISSKRLSTAVFSVFLEEEKISGKILPLGGI
jgi:hypothetical protein